MIEAAPADDSALQAKFQEYRELYPSEADDRVWSAVADAFDLAGDGARVLGALEIAISINPEWGRHHLAAARAWLRAGRQDHALAALETCADLDGSGLKRDVYSESIVYYLGYALFGAGRFKEAAEAWRAADLDVAYWGSPEPLKDFHLHRGWAHHIERDFIDAMECYQRGLIAPGPGDCAMDDDMDVELVEASQDRMNPQLEKFLELARAGELPGEPEDLIAVPYAPTQGELG